MPQPSDREAILRRMEGKEFLSADMPPESMNTEKRTVDCVFFTGIDIPRVDWWTGEPYTLRFEPGGADLSLLNNGAPVLDNHSSWDGSASQKGKVERAWRDGRDWKASLRFSKRKSVDDLWADIEDRIVTKFSMGVEILEKKKSTEKQDGKETALVTATKWRPFELSVAAIPADFGTTTLSAQAGGETRATARKEKEMAETSGQTGIAQDDENTQSAARAALEEQLNKGKELGITAELGRVKTLMQVGGVCGLPQSFVQKHIDNRTSVDEFRRLAIDEQAKRATQYHDTPAGRVMMTRDETDTRRELMSVAMFGMMSPKDRKDDINNPFTGLSIFQMAEESVRRQHGLHGIPKKAAVVELSMQQTSDFANVLESTARKQLQARYAYANPTYRLWTKRSTTPDFKTMTRPRLGEAPIFLTVAEGAQITIGTMADSKESYALATYGRGVSFTRQMLINDDLGAFNDLIGAFGVQAARLENKTVYAILTTNGNMSDSTTLFHADHGNSGTGVIGNTALDAMFTSFATQTGIDGVSVLNLVPRFLIVPAAKSATANAALMAIGPSVKASDQNWFAGRLTAIADAELDGTSTAAWYGACDPADAPGIEYCHLEGAEGPQFIRKENDQAVLGVQFYAYLDFAAKAIDWRPLYYSTGA